MPSRAPKETGTRKRRKDRSLTVAAQKTCAPFRLGPAMIAFGALLVVARLAFAQVAATNPLDQIGLTQRVGQSIPLDLVFRSEAGDAVTIGNYFGRGPVVLAPVFYQCPMLCTQVLNALLRTVKKLDFVPGRDFEVVVFSFDPREAPTLAAEKKLNYLRHEFDPKSHQGWHFLTGEQAAIARLTDAIGYGYVYDAKTDQFAHPAAVVLLTPDGQISRYVIGLEYDARDLRPALIDAGKGTIGSVVDRVLLRCFSYSPESGRYGLVIMNALRAGGILTILGLATLIWRRGRRRLRPMRAGSNATGDPPR